MSILDEIAEKTRERVAAARQEMPEPLVRAQAEALAEDELEQGPFAFPFEAALAQEGMSFICEVKKASPSKGIIAQDFPYLEIARDYEQAGASAISCLTEPFWFMGSNQILKEITQTVSIPVLRKDFTVDPYMIYEAKVLGASAVLLICSLLDDEELAGYLKLTHALGLSSLVEAHDAGEVARARMAGARIVGVNNRNLKDFSVNPQNSLVLREAAGTDVLFVSESGIKTRQDVELLEQAKVDAVLIGETLMRSTDKKALLRQLKGQEGQQ